MHRREPEVSASDLGGPEGEAADLETGERRVKSGAALSAAVGGNISQGGGETRLLVSLGHQGSQHRLGGGLARPDLQGTRDLGLGTLCY